MNTTTPIATMQPCNGYKSCLTQLTIAPGTMTSMRNVACYSSDEVAIFIGLFEGQTVNMRLFSLSNIMFYVTTEQIEAAAEKARATKEPWFSGEHFEKRVEKFKEKFGEGKLSMSINARFIVESRDDMQARILSVGMTGGGFDPV